MGYKIGDVLYFPAEDMTMVVTMVGETGVRYFNPMLPMSDMNGKVQTHFASNETLDESVLLIGGIENYVDSYVAKKVSKI